MKTKLYLDKKTVFLFLGVPFLCLIFMTILGVKNKGLVIQNEANKYLAELPQKYASKVDSIFDPEAASITDTKTNKLGLESFVLDNQIHRELVIIKESPGSIELNQDFKNGFNLEIFPDNKISGNKSSLKEKVNILPTLYKYNGKEYALFSIELPLINIDKLKVSYTPRANKKQGWERIFNKAFKELKFNASALNQAKDNLTNRSKPNIYYPLAKKLFDDFDIKYLEHRYDIKGDSLFEIAESFESFLKKNTLASLIVKTPRAFFSSIESNRNIESSLYSIKGENFQEIESLVKQLNDNEIENVIDLKKIAAYYSILSFLSDGCTNLELRLILSDNTGLLEPIFVDSNSLGKAYRHLQKPILHNANFLQEYLENLKNLSELDITSNVINSTDIINTIYSINAYDVRNPFSLNYLELNQYKIKKNLLQSTMIKPRLISIDKNKVVISVQNISHYPVTIVGLNHKQKKEIVNINPSITLLENQLDTIQIELPRSFENLFVSKKKKATGFLLHKHIYELFVSFRPMAGDKNLYASIIPYQEQEEVSSDLFRDKSLINNHEHIVVKEAEKLITFRKDSIVINEPLIVPEGYTFRLRPGMVVDIVKGGKIISYSPLRFIGNKKKGIKIYSSDKKGQGLLVLSAEKESTLNYVVFDELSNPKHGSWSVTGAITFYESPVKLTNTIFSNNHSEDALNIVRTNFRINRCEINNTQSDAFDGDFVKGRVTNSIFNNLGNDAIDVSGSDITVKSVSIKNAGDKGLSAGEDSIMTIIDTEVDNSEIAVAGKDLSRVTVDNIKMSNTKLGITAFQKKPEFGPSSIIVKGIQTNNIETDYLIESSSTLFVDGKKIETTQNVKDRMYGVEFGRSSAETRNVSQ
ncbi:hypothetical protein [Winogradskyella sp. 3972H.M.0a.05]|uniref:hypothetical protein n=1 Tax=Winogradskyella sp. 3972H.M.0a.05 TaxID=2950277 RepID=UPI0033934D18